MKYLSLASTVILFVVVTGNQCSQQQVAGDPNDCTPSRTVDQSRGACDVTLAFTEEFSEDSIGDTLVISSNNIPEHRVGLFGHVSGALNPNAITEQASVYHIPLHPQKAAMLTPLLSTTGVFPNAGPQYVFGILLNGVELDPIAAEPFPHHGVTDPNANWEWNLEALNVNLGLDCNNAHVQPSGKYHYHGTPSLFLEDMHIHDDEMTLVGYAADGFPVYYAHAYADPYDSTSEIIEMTSSYRLKEGERPGDGITSPCGTYDGVYSNDYEYVPGLGTLDEANGREGVTPEYPDGTYYYVITDDFPSIPRYLRGTPSQDFRIGM